MELQLFHKNISIQVIAIETKLIGIGRGFSPLPPTAPLIRVRKWRLAYYQVEVSKRYQVSTAP